HGGLAEFVDRTAVDVAARLAVEVVDPARFPVATAERQHQGGLVGISGFTEAIEPVFGHGGSLLAVETRRLVDASRAAAGPPWKRWNLFFRLSLLQGRARGRHARSIAHRLPPSGQARLRREQFASL